MRVVRLVSIACLLGSLSVSADTLDKTIAKSLITNPDVKEVFYRYKGFEKDHLKAKGAWRPTLDLNANYDVAKEETPTSRLLEDGSVSTRGIEANITLRQLLFDGQFANNEIDRTKSEAEAEYWALIAQAENTALDVTQAYLNVLKAQKLYALAQDNLKSHQDVYEQIKLRTESGLGTLSDLSQIRGRLARAQANVLASNNNLLDAETRFQRVVGDMPKNLVEPSLNESQIPQSLALLLEKAQENHPTIKSAGRDVDAAQFQMQREKSAYQPNLALELVGSHNDDPRLEQDHINEVKLQLVFNYNFYNGGKDKAAEQASAYRHQESIEVRNSAMRQVIEGARLAWAAKDTLSKQIEFLTEHVDQSKQTKDAYREQFDLARRSLLDLLDTENELFEAQTALIGAEKDYQLTQFRLLNASGVLLDSLNVNFGSIQQSQYQNLP